MNKYEILFLAVMVNACIALCYMAVMGIRKQGKRGILLGFHMLVVPVAGPLFVFFSYLDFILLRCAKVACINPEEISFRKEKIRVIRGDSLQRGINQVPLEEALLESDSVSTRKALLDVLKEDYEDSISILMATMENEDSEVSHYASAAISDVLSKFKTCQKKLEEQYRSHMDDGELLTAYRKYVYKYLSYHVFPQTEENYYMLLCSELMEKAYADFPKMEVLDYENWIDLLLEKGRQEQAEKWILRMQKDYPKTLPLYRAELQYCYLYDRENFGKCLQKIKDSRIMLDEDTLEVVRFFCDV
ncbi:MAG: hypothetical protein MR508_02870 [Lachnospiraceae bacterium]|nr:hypothetical protein [Lachnospiraceae bacterium]